MNNNERGKKGIILSEIKSWIVDAFFLIALIICILGLVYSVIVFSGSIKSNSDSFATMKQTLSQGFSEMASNLSNQASQNNQDKDEILSKLSTIRTEFDLTIESLEKIQEFESTSNSKDLLTFLYTFTSGILIGIAAYFMKQGLKSVNQIKQSKVEIDQSFDKINKQIDESQNSINRIIGEINNTKEQADRQNKSINSVKEGLIKKVNHEISAVSETINTTKEQADKQNEEITLIKNSIIESKRETISTAKYYNYYQIVLILVTSITTLLQPEEFSNRRTELESNLPKLNSSLRECRDFMLEVKFNNLGRVIKSNFDWDLKQDWMVVQYQVQLWSTDITKLVTNGTKERLKKQIGEIIQCLK